MIEKHGLGEHVFALDLYHIRGSSRESRQSERRPAIFIASTKIFPRKADFSTPPKFPAKKRETNGMMVTSGDFAETVVRKNKHWEEEK